MTSAAAVGGEGKGGRGRWREGKWGWGGVNEEESGGVERKKGIAVYQG